MRKMLLLTALLAAVVCALAGCGAIVVEDAETIRVGKLPARIIHIMDQKKS